MTSDSELIGKALGVCHTLTYNEEPQGSAKHTLRELAHRLERAHDINCDQVAWALAAINRYLPSSNAPSVSRARDMQAYALLYELMEVLGLKFGDDSSAHNGTPRDVFTLRRKQDGVKAASNTAAGSIAGTGARMQGA